MSDVYVMTKCNPYEEGSSIMGIYSSMENAKNAIQPFIENDNLKQYICAAFYRWKKLVFNDDHYLHGTTFYQLRNKWSLIKDTHHEIRWHEEYSDIHIHPYKMDNPTLIYI